jgi:hypothetical protein
MITLLIFGGSNGRESLKLSHPDDGQSGENLWVGKARIGTIIKITVSRHQI